MITNDNNNNNNNNNNDNDNNIAPSVDGIVEEGDHLLLRG